MPNSEPPQRERVSRDASPDSAPPRRPSRTSLDVPDSSSPVSSSEVSSQTISTSGSAVCFSTTLTTDELAARTPLGRLKVGVKRFRENVRIPRLKFRKPKDVAGSIFATALTLASIALIFSIVSMLKVLLFGGRRKWTRKGSNKCSDDRMKGDLDSEFSTLQLQIIS